MFKEKQSTKMQSKEIHPDKEILSAFIDAAQSDVETSQIIDALLKDSELRQQYVRMQLINDHLQHTIISSSDLQQGRLRSNITQAINDLPAHFSDDAVSLQTAKTEDISSSWLQTFFKKTVQNRTLSGLSVAASVMFVTLFTLQAFNGEVNTPAGNTPVADNSVPATTVYLPSLIQQPAALPASFVSSNLGVSSGLAGISNENLKQQYQWIEADPELSRQVRQYVNEHENPRAGYNLQPKIRTATYQLSE